MARGKDPPSFPGTLATLGCAVDSEGADRIVRPRWPHRRSAAAPPYPRWRRTISPNRRTPSATAPSSGPNEKRA